MSTALTSGTIATAASTVAAAAPTSAPVTSASAALAAAAPVSASAGKSSNVLIVWQKSTISSACIDVLSKVAGSVNVVSTSVDLLALTPQTIVGGPSVITILWAGNPQDATMAQSVHTFIRNNVAALKAASVQRYVVPSHWFGRLGLKSILADATTFGFSQIKALPKNHPDVYNALLSAEAELATVEHGFLRALLAKIFSFGGAASNATQ